MDTVGTYEAKTHLPRLLEQVAAGAKIVITKHNNPVAVISPVGNVRPDATKLLRDFQAARQGKRLGLSVREAREEGQR